MQVTLRANQGVLGSYYVHQMYMLLHTWSKRSGTPAFDVPLGTKLQYGRMI
eukprot:COSAG02_NODE_9920_length_2075_cov_1.420547_2_plen_51_part_00